MSLPAPRLLLCALLALAFAFPATARADVSLPQLPVPAADALMSTAHALAVAHWGAEPCGGQVGVVWAHMGAGINARSQWMSTDVTNAATYTQCSISYNLDVDWDWPKLCTVIEHELGHLDGHGHVDDPHNVMSPYYVFPSLECSAAAPASVPAPVTTAEAPATTAAPSQATTTAKKATKKKAAKRKASKRKAATRSAKARARGRAARAKQSRAKRSAAKKTAAASPRGAARAAAAGGTWTVVAD
jgi:hypothetical protein